MILALLLAAGLGFVGEETPQDPAEGASAPLDREKERIRSKAPLTAAEKDTYASPAPPAVQPRDAYSLAVVPIEFSDRKLGDAQKTRKTLAGLIDYYTAASSGRFTLTLKPCEPRTLPYERDRFERKDLEKAIAGVPASDGIAFIVPGAIAARSSPLWPHRGVVRSGEKELDYLLVHEEAPVAILAHEFMHLLGFADKYDDEKASVADACILGTGYSVRHPPPPCAECRIQLGWTSAAIVDPAVPGLYRLDPDASRALRIRVTPEGDESLLLEMRDRLLVWHVGGGRKIELLGRFPSESSDRLTPLSDPSFRGRSRGAPPVCITDIRLQDGKAWFRVSLDAPLTAYEEWRRSKVGKRLGD
jgi:hypothetical protein